MPRDSPPTRRTALKAVTALVTGTLTGLAADEQDMLDFPLRQVRLFQRVLKAGHGAGKPTAKVIEEQADIYGFLFKNLGMK